MKNDFKNMLTQIQGKIILSELYPRQLLMNLSGYRLLSII